MPRIRYATPIQKLSVRNNKEITVFSGGLRMSCYECGSNNLETEMNESTGNWFICCKAKACGWVMLYDMYKAQRDLFG